MYIHNTTFIVERSIVPEFTGWARGVFIKAARESGLFGTVTMARILTQVDPDAVNFAIQMISVSLEKAAAWRDEVAVPLKNDLLAGLGAQRVMSFSTDMEVIE